MAEPKRYPTMSLQHVADALVELSADPALSEISGQLYDLAIEIAAHLHGDGFPREALIYPPWRGHGRLQ